MGFSAHTVLTLTGALTSPTMSSFFTLPSAKKRKRPDTIYAPPKKRIASSQTKQTSKANAARRPQRDESISGSEDDDSPQDRDEQMLDADDASSSSNEGGEDEETAAERRLRLAERYLENIRGDIEAANPEGFDAEEIDRDLIAERLIEDVAESKGRMYRDSLSSELDFAATSHSWFRWNSQAVTSIATCAPWAYTVGKELGLTKWRIQDLPQDQWQPKKGKKASKKPKPPPKRKPEQVAHVKGDKKQSKNKSYQGHVAAILAVAASQDGRFVVTGGADRRIIVWDAATLTCLKVFQQHRDSVLGLAFRRGTNQLYSASKDRTIKIWSLDELAYVETLFGHQDEVIDVAALAQERCVSVGARDRTARLWKVVEETQLVFRGGGAEKKSRSKAQEGSIDRVAMIDEEMFVTGSDNGSLSLWVAHKKKPLFVLPLCHGSDPVPKMEDVSAETHPTEVVPEPTPRWITALATIPYSDVILTGSWDGEVRAWRVSDDKKRIEAVGTLGESAISAPPDKDAPSPPSSPPSTIVPCAPIRGFINDISVFERGDRGQDGVCVVVAVGKEHRLGRWQGKRDEGGKNGGVVFEIPKVTGKALAADEA
ncbi:hypothetical protein QTJ16_000859 [Diplocarpon rosae]|uniref:Uncharacterized protein n=1 Tax=Diplocarpon rosae TaxID=946125 RepID=A0AAD9T7E8_9HELO|nr:hypothetical protein QTJ16_000859 [Diplocarpon rosae]